MINTIIQSIFFIPIIFAFICTIGFMICATITIVYTAFTKNENVFVKVIEIFEPDSSAFYANNVGMTVTFIFFFLFSVKYIDIQTMAMVIGAATIPSLWYTIYLLDAWLTMYKTHKNRKSK